MKIQANKKFKKHYKKRIKPYPKLQLRFQQRISLFTQNSKHPLLKDHQLSGAKSHLRAFSITGDYRTVYQPLRSNHIILHDIGTHNQVY